ncbi:cation channel sperm-associated protein subunit gamma 2-like isoform X2 [Limulus polyphemus]|uniref:Cation channel sperm-associated protein subunit gamma 2-like isoform X2 n=1 Tax=Limulus polyphemus TaxID=6850 RepID=A0ABM1SVP6_LIMPO|nr:cation channel sperm-associated protein subunit gamma 2-like isoform X2 [Limulus polyphemus]
MLRNLKVEVRSLGNVVGQFVPGVNLHPVDITFRIWDSGLHCFDVTNSDLMPQGRYHLLMMLGCPPSYKLVFDWQATYNLVKFRSGQKFDCIDAIPNRPCFYFAKEFSPLFLLTDESIGKVERFTGKYTIKIVGGGIEEIQNYTEEEVLKYNLQTEASGSLIWSAVEDHTSKIPVFNHTHNSISWLCQPKSPCGIISPKNFRSPTYQFVMEVSNKDVDADHTNCEFTIRFVVQVHGISLSLLQGSFTTILTTSVILTILLALSSYCLWNDHYVWNKFELWWIAKKNSISFLNRKARQEQLETQVRGAFSWKILNFKDHKNIHEKIYFKRFPLIT